MSMRSMMRSLAVAAAVPVLVTILLAPCASASSASMRAQEIPIGLIPDVSSLARFPASALSIYPGLYADPESEAPVHTAVLRLRSCRAGLLYDPLPLNVPPRSNNRALGGFLALPLGPIRAGATLRGFIDNDFQTAQSGQDQSESVHTVGERDLRMWWLTLGAGLALGQTSYVELAGSMGQIERKSNIETEAVDGDDQGVSFIEECPDPDLSSAVEARMKAGLGQDLALFGLLSFQHEDASLDRRDFSTGFAGYAPFDLRAVQPSKSDLVTGAAALRGKGPVGAEVTAGVFASYLDLRETVYDAGIFEKPDELANRTFRTEATAFVGAAADLREWFRLYGGLAAVYQHTRARNSTERAVTDFAQDLRNDEETLSSRFRFGFRLQAGKFYADAVATNDFGADNPTTALSVGYRF